MRYLTLRLRMVAALIAVSFSVLLAFDVARAQQAPGCGRLYMQINASVKRLSNTQRSGSLHARTRQQLLEAARELAPLVRDAQAMVAPGCSDVSVVLTDLSKTFGFSERDLGLSPGELPRALYSYRATTETTMRAALEKKAEWEAVSNSADILKWLAENDKVNDPADTLRFLSRVETKANESVARAKASCTPVNLGSSFGPSRDQDSVGWCYAYAAADLLSFRLKKEVSAADLAVTYYNSELGRWNRLLDGKGQAELGGGHIAEAIEAGLENGLCAEDKFRSEDNSLADQLPISELLTRVEQINSGWGKTLAGACKDDADLVHRIFPDLSLSQISQSLWFSRVHFVGNLAEKSCSPRITLGDMYVKVTDGSASEIFSAIDLDLDKGSPSSIYLNNGSYLEDGNVQGSGRHGVTLIGRRFNELAGRCEYLVRNMWGSSCNAMPAFDCEEESKGHVWVPQSGLAAGIDRAVTLN